MITVKGWGDNGKIIYEYAEEILDPVFAAWKFLSIYRGGLRSKIGVREKTKIVVCSYVFNLQITYEFTGSEEDILFLETSLLHYCETVEDFKDIILSGALEQFNKIINGEQGAPEINLELEENLIEKNKIKLVLLLSSGVTELETMEKAMQTSLDCVILSLQRNMIPSGDNPQVIINPIVQEGMIAHA